jgi:hypothetical protein
MKLPDPNKKIPRLTKSMYGDLTCKAFGLSNNQMRHNSIINNAGWYNLDGERLGSGDLSLEDMEHISILMDPLDAFIVLAEIDAMWNMPSTFDHSAPGKDYVLQKAIWVIGHDKKNGGTIIRVRDDIKKAEEATQDGVKYFRFTKKEVYETVGYTPKKIDLSSKTEPKKEIKKTMEDKLKEQLNQLKSLKTKSSIKSVPIPAPANPISSPYPQTPVKKTKSIKKVSSSP